MAEVKSLREFARRAAEESGRLWGLAGPAIFTSLAQYSLGAATQVFAGHLTTLELDAVSTENQVIAGLAFGIMLGMGSALETLCGQAYGAKQLNMLGVYMQRSWLILIAMSVFLLPIYLFATPILRFFKQDDEIAVLAGRFALYMIPQLFAYAVNFPMQKFLQSQSKVVAMAVVAAAGLVLHLCLSWVLIVELKLGLVGAAASLNVAWWFVVLGKFVYIVMGYCPGAWNGFSWLAFRDLWAFARLSIGSAIMLCLEYWFYMFLIVLVGHLKNAQVAVAAVSICTNLFGWEIMVFFGFNAAISVRISNELGARRPRAAKFSILVVLISSVSLGLIFFTLVLVLRDVYGVPFTNSPRGRACRVEPRRRLLLHPPLQQHPTCFIRCGSRSRMAMACGLHQHGMLLWSWDSNWLFTGISFGSRGEGNVGWNAKWRRVANIDSHYHHPPYKLEQ